MNDKIERKNPTSKLNIPLYTGIFLHSMLTLQFLWTLILVDLIQLGI